ncbi:anthranilate synthase component I [cf. Phormidesmis sp. LEGE 11477]|uniref:anthranilate synthase component I n=1 Tax=cf. Phormidesmis sp. LEGE 11477 TaxID=1828680 RepID=UPI001882D59A|nr:anthranilate synthase component I [cf. Phormidesmis sp. LEGE 11477]MBE9060139.1 anthranilate synthase component I [cf. Phormidesmis sp. LEGE 11477]
MRGLSPCSVYYWRSLPLEERTGSDIFAALFQSNTTKAGTAGIATLLESPYLLPSESGPSEASVIARYSICGGTPRTVDQQLQLWTPSVGHIVPFLEQLSTVDPPRATVLFENGGKEDALPKYLPFTGGWLGWLGYDLAWEIEHLPWLKEDNLPFPVAFWYEPSEFAVIDHQLQQVWLAAESISQLSGLSTKLLCIYKEEDKEHAIDQEDTDPRNIDQDREDLAQNSHKTKSLRLGTQKAAFEAAVTKAKAHIKAGDVFQVNHSLRFQAQTTADSWSVYRALHTINPSPFASYWHTPWGAVVSCSPERLVQVEDGRAQTRPIAGTRPRGAHRQEDEDYAKQLRGDRKEQAEHIMLVDLERNDLGRVCQWGSVQVEELMTIERYSHVMHLVSNVVGYLTPECSIAQLIAALFPGGTITGCPKVRCMEIIEALEPVRRSLFYGSCGYLDRRGRLDLNILIRTLLLASSDSTDDSDSLTTVWGQVGAGIVADSEPEKEWFESLQKAKAQLLALGL